MLENQLQKIRLNSKNVFIDDVNKTHYIELVHYSDIRWYVETWIKKNILRSKFENVKDEVVTIRAKTVTKKALFKTLTSKNQGLATSINQLLKGYCYEIYTFKKANASVIQILVNEDGFKKGIEINF